jgi:AraC-like DNA-binding protein
MPGDLDSVHIKGGPREMLGIILASGPEDMALDDRILPMAPEDGVALRQRLGATLDLICGNRAQCSPHDIENGVVTLMADAYLSASPEFGPASVHGRRPERIVRMAEERFVADLCAAAGVEKSRLYQAFQRVCGEPPLSYFHKRRLMQARSALLVAAPARGAVKRVALDAGLTAFGRFSVEYRRLFGETPSATLSAPAE